MASMLRMLMPALRIVIISGLPANVEHARAAGFMLSLGEPFELVVLERAIGEAGTIGGQDA